MTIRFHNGFTYKMSDEEAEEAMQYLYAYGIKEFKIKYKDKRVKNEQ